jgi:hypothetical protein
LRTCSDGKAKGINIDSDQHYEGVDALDHLAMIAKRPPALTVRSGHQQLDPHPLALLNTATRDMGQQSPLNPAPPFRRFLASLCRAGSDPQLGPRDLAAEGGFAAGPLRQRRDDGHAAAVQVARMCVVPLGPSP